jgi:heme/copper-type cytochrome/quinol oxidase subunit 3
MKKFFPFHDVFKRPWPLFVSFSVLGLLFNSVLLFHNLGYSFILIIFFFFVLFKVRNWWKKVIQERKVGFHKKFTLKNFYVGMVLMIISEVFFFVRFFWGFFHNCWFPKKEAGREWPPLHLKKIIVDSFSIPLLKTIILLSSGITITWSHHSLISKKFNQFFLGLVVTVILGLIFLFLQKFEYIYSLFSFNTLIYGSCFYMLTGFHGGHVIIGTIFLFVCLIRSQNFQFNLLHHVGLVLAIWYWHFVDVVWLFLFIFLYWYTYLI